MQGAASCGSKSLLWRLLSTGDARDAAFETLQRHGMACPAKASAVALLVIMTQAVIVAY